jgi:hypothetical protein
MNENNKNKRKKIKENKINKQIRKKTQTLEKHNSVRRKSQQKKHRCLPKCQLPTATARRMPPSGPNARTGPHEWMTPAVSHFPSSLVGMAPRLSQPPEALRQRPLPLAALPPPESQTASAE